MNYPLNHKKINTNYKKVRVKNEQNDISACKVRSTDYSIHLRDNNS